MGSEGQPEGSEGLPEGSEGLPEGSECLSEGSEGLSQGSFGLIWDLYAKFQLGEIPFHSIPILPLKGEIFAGLNVDRGRFPNSFTQKETETNIPLGRGFSMLSVEV